MISRDVVEWGYRLILCREPENEAVIEQKMNCSDMKELVGQLLYSKEFISAQPSFNPPVNKWALIESELEFKIWVNLADTAISWPIIHNEFEPVETAFLMKHVKVGDTVVDIGANIGFYSLLFSRLVGPSGSVIGFEPMPFLCERAVMSVRENGFENCYIHNVALGAGTGSAQLVYAPGSPNWGGAFLSFDGTVLPDHASHTVPVRPLSEFLSEQRPSLVKIDIEGGEHLVISASLDILASAKPVIVSEIHSDQLRRVSNVSTGEYIKLIKEIGYKCFAISPTGELGVEFHGDEVFEVVNVAFMPD